MPEFILILYGVDKNHINMITDVKVDDTFYQLRAFGLADLLQLISYAQPLC